MSLKIRRGLEADRLGTTPDEGEFLYVKDTNAVYIGDGTTVGGILVGSVGMTPALSFPIGAVGGANDTFVFPSPPFIVANSGIIKLPAGVAYVLTGSTVVFEPSEIPLPGDIIFGYILI